MANVKRCDLCGAIDSNDNTVTVGFTMISIARGQDAAVKFSADHCERCYHELTQSLGRLFPIISTRPKVLKMAQEGKPSTGLRHSCLPQKDTDG